MEAALALGIADCRKKNVRLDTNMIRTKAKALYDTFVAAAGPDDDGDEEEDSDDPQPWSSSDSPEKKHGFVASKGWFEKFQKRFAFGVFHGTVKLLLLIQWQPNATSWRNSPRLLRRAAIFLNKYLMPTRRVCSGRGCHPHIFLQG